MAKSADPGRKPQPPSPAAARRLRRLYKRKQQADDACRQAADELALAVLECTEQEGASRREIARVLGVGSSTVHGWVRQARQLRENRTD